MKYNREDYLQLFGDCQRTWVSGELCHRNLVVKDKVDQNKALGTEEF